MKDYRDAEAAWQRARALAWHGDAHGAAELVVAVAAWYERGRFASLAAMVVNRLQDFEARAAEAVKHEPAGAV